MSLSQDDLLWIESEAEVILTKVAGWFHVPLAPDIIKIAGGFIRNFIVSHTQPIPSVSATTLHAQLAETLGPVGMGPFAISLIVQAAEWALKLFLSRRAA